MNFEGFSGILRIFWSGDGSEKSCFRSKMMKSRPKNSCISALRRFPATVRYIDHSGISFCQSLHGSGGACLGCDHWTCQNCRFDYCVVCHDTIAYCCGGRCTKCENMVCEICAFRCDKCKQHTCPNCMSDCKCNSETLGENICECGEHKCSATP